MADGKYREQTRCTVTYSLGVAIRAMIIHVYMLISLEDV